MKIQKQRYEGRKQQNNRKTNMKKKEKINERT